MLRLIVGVGLGLVVFAGCDSSPKLIEVNGTLLVGGKPVDKIRVEFWPEGNGPRSVGETDAQGKFTLTSDDGTTKGALAGKHKVVLRDVGILNPKIIGRAAEDVDLTEGRKPRVSSAYDDAHKSPLSAEVSADKKEIQLEAEPYAGP
jgi:hypothetical protein